MDPTCPVLVAKAGGGAVMMRGMFSCQHLGRLTPINDQLSATATFYPTPNGYVQSNDAPSGPNIMDDKSHP